MPNKTAGFKGCGRTRFLKKCENKSCQDALRACLRSSEQEDQEGEVNELQAGIEFAFAVLPQPSALFQPSEAALDNPTFRQHSKHNTRV
jgi:hypothetical protein